MNKLPRPIVLSTRSILILVFSCLSATNSGIAAENSPTPTIKIHVCDDFVITGRGDASAWRSTDWVQMQKREGGDLNYSARFKMLYSAKGIYVLFDGSDKKLTATMQEDFLDLWNEDVYECFFWTDEQHPIYFEYEISPLGYELPILVPKIEGKFLGWRPWHYEGERRIKRKVSATGGKSESNADVTGWRAEIFIPYDLLKPLSNVPPKPGSQWRANFYRVDYDSAESTSWDWSRVGPSFHEIENFGRIVFD